jgi:hypothetical protein
MIIQTIVTKKEQPITIKVKNSYKLDTWLKNEDGSITHNSNLLSSIKLKLDSLTKKSNYRVSFDLETMSNCVNLQFILGDNKSKVYSASGNITENIPYNSDKKEIIFTGKGVFTLRNFKIEKYILDTRKISFDDPFYFINKSFTVSYSFKTNSWISFHSYLPNYYISNNNFYSILSDEGIKLKYRDFGFLFNSSLIEKDYGYITDSFYQQLDYGNVIDNCSLTYNYGDLNDYKFILNNEDYKSVTTEEIAEYKDYGPILINNSKDNNIYQHNIKGTYGCFYNKKYPFILEIVSNKNINQTKIWNNLEFIIKSRKYNQTFDEYFNINEIFSNIILYNDIQSSGLLNITTEDENKILNLEENNNNIIAKNKENHWYINNIRDYVVETLTPIFTKEWDAIKNDYPIDKIVNQEIINYEKNWFETEQFRDTYLIVRLINKNEDETLNLIINYNINNIIESKR